MYGFVYVGVHGFVYVCRYATCVLLLLQITVLFPYGVIRAIRFIRFIRVIIMVGAGGWCAIASVTVLLSYEEEEEGDERQ